MRSDACTAAVAALVLTAATCMHMFLVLSAGELARDTVERWGKRDEVVLRWSGELGALRDGSRKGAASLLRTCVAAVEAEGQSFRAATEAALDRMPRGGAQSLGRVSAETVRREVHRLGASLTDHTRNLNYTANTIDKLLYELKNFAPAKAARAAPPFNPVPLADQTGEVRNLVIGVSSVNRRKNYLLDTLRNLFAHLTAVDKVQCKVVVLNGDVPPSKHQDIPMVRSEFAEDMESGLLTIVNNEDPEGGHPELADPAKLTLRWGDSPERVRWRAKQVLDVARLMDVCSRSSEYDYFLMLEDDVHAADAFPTAIRRWVDASLSWRTDWTVASFYNPWAVRDREEIAVFKFFGVIGQLFRMTDLPWVVEFLKKNFDESPLDWLFVDLLTKHGAKMVAHSPSKFQHMGVVSSLNGKIQGSHAVDFKEHSLA
eukprot:TRINITY_DN32478_c0_g1_i1.p1 TRINITY_DN32478_c0_g1~~TRINITY_DN32478_c0_g1_i1.p1  ORF type:complete len:429 (+),score=80.75 TRINITY_DN32478_c0_g1_i1:194-1480(+)